MHAKHADNSELNELSGRVIGCAFTVLNTLRGSGKRQNEVRAAGLSAVQQYDPRYTTKTSWRAGISWAC